jgi:sterol 3beta-glucosyltransferase
MNITLITWGSYGDVLPYIAFALELEKVGHVVKFVTTPDFEQVITQRGLKFQPLDCKTWYLDYSIFPDFEKLAREYGSGCHQNPWIISRFFNRILIPFYDSFLPVIYDVCQGAEAIIFSPSAFPAYDVVEKLGIPGCVASVVPMHPTSAFPNHFTPSNWHFGSIYNWCSHIFFHQLLWQFTREPINQWRKEMLNLPAISPFSYPIKRMNQQKLPFLYGYSSAFLPKPTDWPDWAHLTGYWFLEPDENWLPPDNLLNFLAAGTPPIYLGFTSKGGWDAEDVMQMVVEALLISGQRGIVLKDEDISDRLDLPDNILQVEWVNFEWLFPRMSAVVHHGGCGTNAYALRAGVPSIIIPNNYDNFLWANRVAELGLGLPPIKRNELSAKTLAAAITAVVNDKTMQSKATDIAKKIQAENGVKYAVELFNAYINSESCIDKTYVQSHK